MPLPLFGESTEQEKMQTFDFWRLNTILIPYLQVDTRAGQN